MRRATESAANSSFKIGENRMNLTSRFLFIVGYFIIHITTHCVVLQAQETDKKLLIIRSEPPGAMLYFEGENSFVGVAPFRLRPGMVGNYQIVAVKSGYEKRKFDYFFRGSETGVMKIRLFPKTAVKAGLRSLVFPGWGQYYSERKTSGIVISLINIGVGLGTLASHRQYEHAVSDYETALENYNRYKKDYDLYNKYWNVVAEKHKKADDVFERRQTWLYLTGTLWIYNFLDSILFFPSFENEIFSKSAPSISAKIQDESVALCITMPF